MPAERSRRAGRWLGDWLALARLLASGHRTRPGGARAGIPPALADFVAQLPEERASLLTFVADVAGQLAPGTRLLDAGAGDAPYRELFAHCDYVTADWTNSPHEQAHSSDITASLYALPVGDASFDAVLSTQVLEHVAEPSLVLSELHRVLRPGGRLYLTVPLVGELHEEPYDYYRYTPHGLRHLLTAAGFHVESVTARNGYFTTLAGLMRTGTWSLARGERAQRPELAGARRLLIVLARVLPALDELDELRLLPLGYTCVATRRDA
jgi:SAM-dependent methyltransferase